MKHSGQINCFLNQFHLQVMIGTCYIVLSVPMAFPGEKKLNEANGDTAKKILAQLICSQGEDEWQLSLVQRAAPPKKVPKLEAIPKMKEGEDKFTSPDPTSFNHHRGDVIFEIIRTPLRQARKNKSAGEVIGVVYGADDGMMDFSPTWKGSLLWHPGKKTASIILCKRKADFMTLAVFELNLTAKSIGASPLITKKTRASGVWPSPLRIVSEKKIISLYVVCKLSRISSICLDTKILVYLECEHTAAKSLPGGCPPRYMLYDIKAKAWSKVTLQKVPSQPPGKKNQSRRPDQAQRIRRNQERWIRRGAP